MRRREEQSAHKSCGNLIQKKRVREKRKAARKTQLEGPPQNYRVHVPLTKRCPRHVAQAAAGPQAVLVPAQHVMADDGL